MKEGLLTRSDLIIFVVLTCISTSAIVAFLVHWFSFGDWLVYPVSFSILTLIVLVKVANSQTKWFSLLLMKRPRPIGPRVGLKIAVVTTIVPEAESHEMLEKTVRAMVALDYPHDTWVLDEGDQEEIKALCQRTGALHFSRKNIPHYQSDGGTFQARSKHGNYNAWLYEIGFDRYEIITAFDPDHVPIPSFLARVLGYFEDATIGYVQTAQAYYNQRASFLARGAAEETYEYYSCSQMAAYNFDQPAVVGCHNTHRAAALKDVGGFAAHDADDLLIGLRYQTHGWRGVYVPEILARGLTPVDWNGYLTQQLRWARSVIDIKCRLHRLLGKKLSPVGQALSAVHGLFYLQNSITTFLIFLLLAYMLATGHVPQVLSWTTLAKILALGLVLQLCAFYRQRFYLAPRKEWGTHWRAAVLRYAKWPVFLWALWDVAMGHRVPYALTLKVRAQSRSYLLLIPHLLVITVLCAACATGLLLEREIPWLLYWVAAVLVTASLGLILTGWLPFPAPYDESLLPPQPYGGNSLSALDNPQVYGSN